MAWIKVDCGNIRHAADLVERYTLSQRQHMQQIEEELVGLGGQWSGADYQQVMREWNQLDSPRSVSGKMLRELEEQVRDLRWAAQEYEKARNRAISRAKRLKG